jgi:hypothetical protein
VVLDALERIFEELERIGEPRELFLLTLAMTMVAYGAFGGLSDSVAVALIAIGSGMFFVGIFLSVLSELQIGPGAALAGSPEAGRELLERALVERSV